MQRGHGDRLEQFQNDHRNLITATNDSNSATVRHPNPSNHQLPLPHPPETALLSSSTEATFSRIINRDRRMSLLLMTMQDPHQNRLDAMLRGDQDESLEDQSLLLHHNAARGGDGRSNRSIPLQTMMLPPRIGTSLSVHEQQHRMVHRESGDEQKLSSNSPSIEPTPLAPTDMLQVVDRISPQDSPLSLLSSMQAGVMLDSLRPLLHLPRANRKRELTSSLAQSQGPSVAKRRKPSDGSSSSGGGDGKALGSGSFSLLKKEPQTSTPSRMRSLSSASSDHGDSSSPKKLPVGGYSALKFRASHLEQWGQKYQELLQYRLEHGHCLVPFEYKPNQTLSHWVKRQRCQYKLKIDGKRSTLTDARQRALEELGFIWDSHQASWEEKFHELCAFKNLFGHCDVPTTYVENPQLAMWLKTQRRQLRLYHQQQEQDDPAATDSTNQGVKDGTGFNANDDKNEETATTAAMEASGGHDDGEEKESSSVSSPTGKKVIKSSLTASRVAKLLQLGVTWEKRNKKKRKSSTVASSP